MDDAFARMEPWIEVHFGFDAADDMLTEDARPYKHITCNMMARLFVPLYLLWTARRREEVRGAILVGAPQHLVDAYVHLFGEQPTVASRWDVVPNRLVNPIILSMCALAVLVAGARRLRPLASVRHMTLGADFINDPRGYPDLDGDRRLCGARARRPAQPGARTKPRFDLAELSALQGG